MHPIDDRRLSHLPLPALALVAVLSQAGCEFPGSRGSADTRSPELAALEAALQDWREEYQQLARSERELQESVSALREEVAALSAQLSPEADPAARPPTEASSGTEEPAKLVVGRRENVWVEDLQLALPARIDTGAETASLDARNITAFERDGESWVRFDIPHPRGEQDITLERPKVREALITQASTDQPERRVVIELGVQLGPVRQLAEFTLSNRGHLDYQMLVGRNILRDVILVDVSRVNLVPLPSGIGN